MRRVKWAKINYVIGDNYNMPGPFNHRGTWLGWSHHPNGGTEAIIEMADGTVQCLELRQIKFVKPVARRKP